MFRFANPEYLYLLLIIPILIGIYLLLRRRRRRLMARFGDNALVRELMPDYSSARLIIKASCLLLAYTMLILAIARPQTGSRLEEHKSTGVEIVLAVDVSNSMLAEDFEPNRLERTKYAISKLLDELKHENIGLVVFAGEAKVQYPIADDYHLARSFTKRISTSLIAEQGTDIEKALRQSILAFSNTEAKNRAIILITDGENHDGDLSEVLEQAQEEGIRIYTIGIGTPEGAPIKIGNSYLKDEQQKMVVSKLGEATLTQIATQTGGIYIRASKQDLGLSDIIKSINQMEKGAVQKHSYSEYTELYMYPLMVAFVLLIVELMILSRRNHRIKRFTLFDKK